jgi:uncharacterized BrkB/YihY/UPF0761 family membrane protein
MLQQSDVEGRLRLFRYGLVVIVVVAFTVSLLIGIVARQALIDNLEGEEFVSQVPGVDVFFGVVALTTIATALLAVIVYFAYHYILTKKLPFGLLDNSREGT